MAFKLTKTQETEWKNLIEIAQDRMHTLNAAIEEYNEHVVWTERVLPALEQYNSALASLKECSEAIAAVWQTEFDERSEKWQESERGGQVSELIQAWEALDFEEPEIDEPDDIPEVDDVLGEAEELPTAAD